MKVLSIIHYPVFGGPHNRNVRLIPKLAASGFEVHVLLPDGRGNAQEKFNNAHRAFLIAPFHRMRATLNLAVQFDTLRHFISDIKIIRKCIRRYSINLVLINGLVNPHAAIAARLENIPVVWQILDTRPPMILRRFIMPLVVHLADAVMSTGLQVAKDHPGTIGFGDRLITFFPPVDTASFKPDISMRAFARKTLNVPEEALLIGTVGNLNPQKGHEHLIRAAGEIKDIIPKFYVRIIGAYTPTQACYYKQLQLEARQMGLLENDRLQFSGSSDRVQDLLPAFDIFVMTPVPLSEGIPTVILEAMSCGIPVIATDVGSVREVVEHGKTGFVVPPLDHEAVAAATLRLLKDHELRQRMGAEARRRAVEKYDVEVCADTHVRAFEAAIAHHRLRRS